MSIESEIDSAIQSAFRNLTIEAELDCDNDIKITIYLDSNEISAAYVEISRIYLTKEP